MALGKGKTEHSGPRDMSRKSGHWGVTEEAKAWASRARRRDEVDDLRREVLDRGAESQAEPIDALTGLWLKRWPDCRPIGHELRHCAPDHWVRFHSLPESKRYADTDDDYAEVLHRHYVVIDELVADSGGNDEVIVVTVEWSVNDTLEPRPAEFKAAFPATPWTNVLQERDGNDKYWTHLFISQLSVNAPAFDLLLRLVVDDVVADVIIADSELNWLYHPHDGGADVIASSTEQREGLRAAHRSWLSSHGLGL